MVWPISTDLPGEGVFTGIRDVLIGEAVEEATGKRLDEHLEDALNDSGFVPSESADAEAEYKQTASKPGEAKLKKVFGRESKRNDNTTLLGIFEAGSELEVKKGVVEVNPAGKSGEINALEVEEEAWLHRMAGSFDTELGELPANAVLTPALFVASGPFAARVGDPMMHGGVAAPGPGSPDVLIGGKPAVRASDSHVCPMATPNPHGPGAFVAANSDVLINGRPAVRAGDYVWESVGGNPVVMGCPTVCIGSLAPPVECSAVVFETRHILELQGQGGVDFGYVIAKVKAGIGIDGSGISPTASAEVDASVARPWFKGSANVNIPLNIDVDLPRLGHFHRDYLTFGIKPELELRVLTVGADGKLQPGGASKGRKGAAWVALGKNKLKTYFDLQKADE